jgi:hypothetical protein
MYACIVLWCMMYACIVLWCMMYACIVLMYDVCMHSSLMYSLCRPPARTLGPHVMPHQPERVVHVTPAPPPHDVPAVNEYGPDFDDYIDAPGECMKVCMVTPDTNSLPGTPDTNCAHPFAIQEALRWSCDAYSRTFWHEARLLFAVWRRRNGEVLVGRDVIPFVGMRVLIARQTRRFLYEQGQPDPSQGGAGTIVRLLAATNSVAPVSLTRDCNGAYCKVSAVCPMLCISISLLLCCCCWNVCK